MTIDMSSYTMPIAADLPVNTVDWTSDPDRSVLLIHDMQSYFVAFFENAEPVNTLIDNVVALRAAAVAAGVPVIYTAQPGSMTTAERGLLLDIWGPGMQADPRHNSIIPALAPEDTDRVLTKWRYSAFAKSELQDIMTDHGRDQLVISGVYAHVGCMITAADAYSMDIEPFFVADGVADFNRGHHLDALTWVSGRCGSVTTTSGVVSSWKTDDGRQSRKRGTNSETKSTTIT